MDNTERDDLRRQLDEKGIKYHHKHGVAKLKELLGQSQEVSEEEVQRAVDDVLKKDLPEPEEFLRDKMPVEGGHVTKAGVFLPLEATKHIRLQRFAWTMEHSSTEAVVMRNGKEFRRYSQEIHGDNFKELAEMFTDKQNQK